MTDPKKDLPKVPPFIIPGASNNHEDAPNVQPAHVINGPAQPPRNNNHYPSARGMLVVTVLVVSLLSVGIAMAGGAWIAVDALSKGLENQVGVLPKVLAVGMAYLIGWVVSIFGVRVVGHLILPFIVKAYAWFTLAGICALQIAIITKLFNQSYTPFKFSIYLVMMGTGLLALIGFHLILENHSLAPFSFPILIASLGHLVVIVLHYVFVELPPENYAYFWGDAIFFLLTTVVGVLMLAHFGVLNGFRNMIDRMFNPKNDHFIPAE